MTVEANVVKDICPCEGQKGKAKASEFGEAPQRHLDSG